MDQKRLYKSNRNKMICGVCGGIGEFLGIDPTIIRLVVAVFGIMGWGILAYIVAAIIIPNEY